MGRAFAAAAAGALLLMGFVAMAAPTGEPAGKLGAQAPAVARQAAPQASKPPTTRASTCIYLVRGLQRATGLYLGDFLVLRRTGANLRGYGGSFYSEGYDVRATISGNRIRIGTEDPYEPGQWESVTRKWLESQDRISGWKRVTRAKLKKYSGGYVPVPGRVCG